MELFPPLSAFYKAIAHEARIGSTHISIYMALFQQWNKNGGNNPIKIERTNIMKAAKINSRQTYNKCLNELKDYGYIDYKPSPNQFGSSIIMLKNIELETC